MPRHKHSNPELLDCGIDLVELAKIEVLEKLRDQCNTLMTTEHPQIAVHIDGKRLMLKGHDARAFGCGMQIVLMEIGYQAVDPWMEN